jgi:hypothetical protein
MPRITTINSRFLVQEGSECYEIDVPNIKEFDDVYFNGLCSKHRTDFQLHGYDFHFDIKIVVRYKFHIQHRSALLPTPPTSFL